MPAIVSRAAWGANESIRRAPPSYAPSVRFAIVHHTAGTNTYSRDEAAAIVRGIQLYHVRGNGWNDIGYNFLVDRFGTIYEGRYGGVDRNVVGAHALGFNTGSTGIALLGTYGDAKPISCCAGLPHEAARLATGSRPRRPALGRHRSLRRERAVPSERPGVATRDLGSSRHGSHRVPGRSSLRPAERPRGGRRQARRAEDLRPACGRGRGGAGQVHAHAHRTTLPWTVVVKRGGAEVGSRRRDRDERRLDLGCERSVPGDVHVVDLRRGGTAGERHRSARVSIRRSSRSLEPSATSRGHHAERRRAGGRGSALVHVDHGRERDRRRSRLPRADRRDRDRPGAGPRRARIR